jgi:hypothetical protein
MQNMPMPKRNETMVAYPRGSASPVVAAGFGRPGER